ncbi:MAG: DUF2834 domain-containing protein [Paracoccaceae bacterium]|nr:DUF2834 domain-containing protein [Paracoccaceae bacterium]
MSGLRLIYLLAALLAAGFAAVEWSPPTWASLSAAPPMVCAGVAFALWVLAEVMVRRNWIALVVLPVGLLLGLGPALPLYLYFRTRKIS